MNCCACRHAAARDDHNAQRDSTLRQMARLGNLNCLKSNCRASFMAALKDHGCELFEPTDTKTRKARETYFMAQENTR